MWTSLRDPANSRVLRSTEEEVHDIDFGPGLQLIFFSTLAVFVAQLILDSWWDGRYSKVLDPLRLSPQAPQHFWTFLTYAWLHQVPGLSHFGWNMTVLCIFGVVLENRLGARRFVEFYCFAAGCSGAAFWVTSFYTSSEASARGASGAISGCVALAAIAWRRDKVRVIAFNVSPWWMALFWLVKDIYGFITEEALQLGFVAHSGHLGGVIAAVIYDRLLLTGVFIPSREMGRRRAATVIERAPWRMHLKFMLWRMKQKLARLF
jgi:membrane associated rhomboid family serine protease